MFSLLKAVQRGTCFLNSRGASTFKLIKQNLGSRQGGDDGNNSDSFQAGGFGGNRGGFSKPYGNSGGYGGSRGGNNGNNSYGKSTGFQNKNKFLDSSKTVDDAPSNNNASYENDNHLGENLQDVDFSKVQLAPFQKIFFTPSKSIHSEETISNYQTEKGIMIKSKHEDVPQPLLTWPETKFPKYIMSVVEENKFSDPMPIQAQSYPIVLGGHDLIGIAQTGSGKTLAFVLPALVHINAQDPVRQGEGPIVLVLAPTRELANQIQEQCYKFGSRCKINSVCVYGGAPKFHQEKELRRGCDIVIATPGRLIDFLEGNVIDLKRVTYLVLDEADRMLDMGFEPSIRKIVGQIRPDRQTLMFSATWPQSVRKLALDFCHASPIHIQIGSMENNVNKDIEQIVEIVAKNQRYERIKELLLGMERTDKTIIFTQTKKDCDELSEALSTENIRNACIHGDKSQRERDKVMDQFKSGRINTLIATDVASRGLDVKDIKLVVNFDFPFQMEDYIHRVGRTGRAGATGKAISFIDPREDKRIVQELVEVLRQSNQVVSEELQELAGNGRGGNSNGFKRGGGYGGYNKYTGNSNGGYSNNRNRSSSNGERYSSNSGNFRNNNSGENGNSQTQKSYGSRTGGYSSYNKDFRNRENSSQGQGESRQHEDGSFSSKKE